MIAFVCVFVTLPGPVAEEAVAEEVDIQEAVAEERGNRHWGVVPLPIIAYSPDTGGMFGVAAMFFYGPDVGVPPEEKEGYRNNIAMINGIVTTNGSYVVAAATTNYLQNEFIRLDTALASMTQPRVYYGRGRDADDEESYVEDQIAGKIQIAAQIAPDTFLGPLYHWERNEIVQVDSDGALAAKTVTGSEQAIVLSGPGVGIVRDSTGGVFWPESGSKSSGEFTVFHPALGSSESFGLYRLCHTQYIPAVSNHVLAVQGTLSGSWGTVPFQHLPSIGGDGVMRGHLEGRYRDTVAAVVQAEYRMPLGESVAVVGFGSLGQVGQDVSGLLSGNVHGAGGIGFRIALNREQRLNLRVDLAVSSAGMAPYVNMGEAF